MPLETLQNLKFCLVLINNKVFYRINLHNYCILNSCISLLMTCVLDHFRSNFKIR